MISRSTRIAGLVLMTAALAVVLVARSAPPLRNVIAGPYARLLAAAADLGPTRSDRVHVTATLRDASAPALLGKWARAHDVSVRWHAGDNWAVVEGAPAAIAGAFGVAVRDYRLRRGPDAGRVFYASP